MRYHIGLHLRLDMLLKLLTKKLIGQKMTPALQAVWDWFPGPVLQRPPGLQVAAMCYRHEKDVTEILLVTSRETGRWIIPKGWPIRGLKSNEAALQEAWEEAGVRNSRASAQPVGAYTYQKRRPSGLHLPVETLVYAVKVESLSETFPEAAERRRKWFHTDAAANLVHEPELKAILRRQ